MTKKSELIDLELLGFLVENNQDTGLLDSNARSEALSALTMFAKPVMPTCAICLTPASSTAGKQHEELVNHELYAETFKKLSEEEQKARKIRIKLTAMRRSSKACANTIE